MDRAGLIANPNWFLFSDAEKEAVIAGEAAVIRLTDDRGSFENWLQVGHAVHLLQEAARQRANSPNLYGRAYGRAYRLLCPPQLLKLSSFERGSASRLFRKEQFIREWYEALDPAKRRKLTSPGAMVAAWRTSHCPRKKPKRRRTVVLDSPETMVESWQSLVALYGDQAVIGFWKVGMQTLGLAELAQAAQ